MSTITISANTLEAGAMLRVMGVVRVESAAPVELPDEDDEPSAAPEDSQQWGIPADCDPIADMRHAVEDAAKYQPQPQCLLMSAQMHDWIVREIERARSRHEIRMRKPLLSGRYGKRKRQRAQGVARMRHMKREHSRRWLAMVKAATYPAAVVKGGDDV
jgi:hypothetical protein